MAITKHLAEMRDRLPKDIEFTRDDLSPSQIYRMDWVLGRLVDEGVLERRVEWAKPGVVGPTISFYKFKS